MNRYSAHHLLLFVGLIVLSAGSTTVTAGKLPYQFWTCSEIKCLPFSHRSCRSVARREWCLSGRTGIRSSLSHPTTIVQGRQTSFVRFSFWELPRVINSLVNSCINRNILKPNILCFNHFYSFKQVKESHFYREKQFCFSIKNFVFWFLCHSVGYSQ